MIAQYLTETWKDIGNLFVISLTAINIFYKAVHIYRIGEDRKNGRT
jgi:hypothetical protein